MFVIRNEHMDALRPAPDQSFVQEMVAHVRNCFPDKTANQNDVALTKYIETAINKARTYLLYGEQDLCRLINISMIHGLDWEASEDRRWLHEGLMNPSWGSPSQRLMRVHRQCLYQLEAETVDDTQEQ